MSSVVEVRARATSRRDEATAAGGPVLPLSIAAIAVTTLALAASVPAALVLPALALAATIGASVCGMLAWRAGGQVKSNALMAAGIFALAAIAASILGEPDQVALLLK